MIAVILKTHLWNEDIERFALKTLTETVNNGLHFYLLMHSNDFTLVQCVQNVQLKNTVLQFSEECIKSTYPSGFYNMWLSNHWILMWFYRYHSNYKYIWSVEYDVRIAGNGSILWTDNCTTDFIYVRGNHTLANAPYQNYYTGNLLTKANKYYGFLQLARYSALCLATLDKCYQLGENGQDELITFSLIRYHNLTTSDKLKEYICGYWTWDSEWKTKNKLLWMYWCSKYPRKLALFHPVK